MHQLTSEHPDEGTLGTLTVHFEAAERLLAKDGDGKTFGAMRGPRQGSARLWARPGGLGALGLGDRGGAAAVAPVPLHPRRPRCSCWQSGPVRRTRTSSAT